MPEDNSTGKIQITSYDMMCGYIDPSVMDQGEDVTYEDYIVGTGMPPIETINVSCLKVVDPSAAWQHKADFTSAQIHLDSVADQLSNHPVHTDMSVEVDDLTNPDFYDTCTGLR